MKEFSAKKIIIKYLSSEATATEKEQLYTWVETKKNRKIFKEFVKAQQLIDIKYKTVDSESAFNDFLNQIKNLAIPRDAILATLDVTSLYTNLLKKVSSQWAKHSPPIDTPQRTPPTTPSVKY